MWNAALHNRDRAVHKQSEALSAFEEKSFLFCRSLDSFVLGSQRNLFSRTKWERIYTCSIYMSIYKNTGE